MLTLGIDIGTSGVRTAVLQGEVVLSTARAAHLPQGERIDAALWWQAVRQCLTAQMANMRAAGHDPSEIAGIAVDGTSGSMVLTDGALQPVSPALMYNSKGFEAEAARIADVAPAGHITQGANSALARAMRLVAQAEARPEHLLHQADFIAAKLCGVGGHSDYNNALKTGFDPEREAWPDWAEAVIDPALLPAVHAPGRAYQSVSAETCADFGLAPGTCVHAGTTDSIAAFLAAAPLEEGLAVTSLGSTLAVKLLSPVRIDDAAIGLYSHRLGDGWLVGGASNTGGAVLQAHFSSDEIAELSTQMRPEVPTGLDYYPLLGPGERFPINDPHYPARLAPRPESDVTFLQGMFEGMARIETLCYREMEARGAAFPQAVFTAGGGAQNPVWSQIRGAHLGIAPQTAQQTEASIGVARLIQKMPAK